MSPTPSETKGRIELARTFLHGTVEDNWEHEWLIIVEVQVRARWIHMGWKRQRKVGKQDCHDIRNKEYMEVEVDSRHLAYPMSILVCCSTH